jgi:hypothetical protein
MAPSRILVTGALLSALAVPTTAGAAQPAAKSHRPAARAAQQAKPPSPISAATAVGVRYWGGAPCKGQFKVLAKRPLPANVDAGSDAWATFDSPLGANNLAAPASTYTNCAIGLSRSLWRTSASMRKDWDMFCTTMIHELGHLLGKAHDSTLGNVMVPVFADHSSVPQICRATRPSRSIRSRSRR